MSGSICFAYPRSGIDEETVAFRFFLMREGANLVIPPDPRQAQATLQSSVAGVVGTPIWTAPATSARAGSCPGIPLVSRNRVRKAESKGSSKVSDTGLVSVSPPLVSSLTWANSAA